MNGNNRRTYITHTLKKKITERENPKKKMFRTNFLVIAFMMLESDVVRVKS